jgi:hypothetical protein
VNQNKYCTRRNRRSNHPRRDSAFLRNQGPGCHHSSVAERPGRGCCIPRRSSAPPSFEHDHPEWKITTERMGWVWAAQCDGSAALIMANDLRDLLDELERRI